MNGPSDVVAIDWDLPVPQWERLLAACPAATLYHWPRWAETMSAVFGGRPRAIRFTFEDGTWALWPLNDKPLARGRLPFAVSGEAGGYGGPLFPMVPRPAQILEVCQAVARRWPSLEVHGNPLGLVRLPWRGRPNFTHVVAPVAARPSRGCRARINKAQRGGFSVCELRSAEPFLELYDQAVRRWGDRLTWRRPDAYFTAVMTLPGVRCFVASSGAEPAAAMIVGVSGKVGHYLAGAIGSNYLETGASNLLLYEILQWARQTGLDLVDLGPSAGLAGVVQFKESFGAQPVAFESWSLRTPAHWIYEQARALGSALKI